MSEDLDARLREAVANIDEAMAVIDAMQRRIVELEAELALLRGTFAQRGHGDETPTQITHDVPPNAPR